MMNCGKPAFLLNEISQKLNFNNVMRKVFISIFLLFGSFLQAQELEKSPRMKSIEVGLKYAKTGSGWVHSPISKMAPTIQFNYGWQLSGFKNKKKAFIHVPIGITFFPKATGKSQANILHYGWAVTHDLKKNQNSIPFFGYNLMLNQIKIDGKKGRDIGHETRFEFGYRLKAMEKTNLILKLDYGMSYFPNLYNSPIKQKTASIHAMALKLGVVF